MRIAILTSLFYQQLAEVHGQDRIVFGGAERYLVELCRLLRDEGHEVAVYQSLPQTVRGDDGTPRRVPCGQLTREYDGLPVVCLPDTDDGWSLSTNSKLNNVFNELGTFYDLRVYFATFLCFPHVREPSISISHGIFWDYPQGQLALLSRAEREEFFRRQLYGFTAPDACVAVDSNVKRVLMALEPGAERRVHVMPNFVDTEKFRPAPKTWDGIRVLYPRRLTQLRGCNDLIRASQQYPQYEYLAVGQAADAQLEASVRQWGEGTSNLRFVWRPMDGMEEIYQQADIAVIPTKACEGLSLSLLEAMACGLPLITTNVGGLGDAVIDGYNALVYDPQHEDLGSYIHFLAENEELRRKMGERNRQIVVECFDISLWRKKWKALLRRFV